MKYRPAFWIFVPSLTEFGTSGIHGNELNDGEFWEHQSSEARTLLEAVNAVSAHIFGITVGTWDALPSPKYGERCVVEMGKVKATV